MVAPVLLRTKVSQCRERLAVEAHRKVRPAHRAVARDPEVRPRDICELAEKTTPPRWRPRRSGALCRHLEQLLPPARQPSRLRSTSARRFHGARAAGERPSLLRATALRLRTARSGKKISAASARHDATRD